MFQLEFAEAKFAKAKVANAEFAKAKFAKAQCIESLGWGLVGILELSEDFC